jgi:hypothetical protein
MPTRKKEVKKKTKTINKNKNKNKNTVIVNVNSHNRKVKKEGTNEKKAERYPHSHFGIAPPVHVVVNHITPDQKPMNVAVERKESNPISHGISTKEEKGEWEDPEKASRLSLLHAAAEAAEARLNKGKGIKSEASSEHEEEAEEEVPIKRTLRQIPKMFEDPEGHKPTLTSGVPEIFGYKRRKSESEASDSAYRGRVTETFGSHHASSSVATPKSEKYKGNEAFEPLLNKYEGLATREEINKFCKDVIGYDPSGTKSTDWKKQIKSTLKKKLKEKREQWEKEEH